MEELILKDAKQGSRIITDGWKIYINLRNLGYGHLVVNHSETLLIHQLVHTQIPLRESGMQLKSILTQEKELHIYFMVNYANLYGEKECGSFME